MATSASSTPAAAITPSIRLVVARLGSMGSSERRRLMRRRITQRGRLPFAERRVQKLPPFAGDVGGLVDRAAKMAELAGEVVERRIELPPQRSTALREEQVPGQGARDGAHDGCRDRLRVVRHARLPFL